MEEKINTRKRRNMKRYSDALFGRGVENLYEVYSRKFLINCCKVNEFSNKWKEKASKRISFQGKFEKLFDVKELTNQLLSWREVVKCDWYDWEEKAIFLVNVDALDAKLNLLEIVERLTPYWEKDWPRDIKDKDELSIDTKMSLT